MQQVAEIQYRAIESEMGLKKLVYYRNGYRYKHETETQKCM
jgi:hypothetical protein